MNNRALGALLGAACGDALGTTLEFSRPSFVKDYPFPNKLTGPLTDIEGGGPFNVDEGQITDDTQMAATLAQSLMVHRRFDATDVAKRYAQWRAFAFDIGGQTSGSISRIPSTKPGEEYTAGYLNWSSGRSAAGNGSLMRATPIGVFFRYAAEARTEASVLDSAITHADPRCMLACSAYNWAIARGLQGAGRYAMFSAAEQGIESAIAYITAHPKMRFWFEDEELLKARAALYTDLEFADQDEPGNLADMLHSSAGFVRTAFRYAFWSLRHAHGYREAIIDVVNRGGDADTNGAIVGGLLGAHFGVGGEHGVPEEWTNKVVNALKDRPESVWWNKFHPRFMVGLAKETWSAPALDHEHPALA